MNVLVKDKLQTVCMLTRRSALKLEILGMKRSRSPSAYMIIKRAYGLTGNREHVLEQLDILIKEEQERQAGVYHNVHAIK